MSSQSVICLLVIRRPAYHPPCVDLGRRSTDPAGCGSWRMGLPAAAQGQRQGLGTPSAMPRATHFSCAAITNTYDFCPASSYWRPCRKVSSACSLCRLFDGIWLGIVLVDHTEDLSAGWAMQPLSFVLEELIGHTWNHIWSICFYLIFETGGSQEEFHGRDIERVASVALWTGMVLCRGFYGPYMFSSIHSWCFATFTWVMKRWWGNHDF